jgi:hypothetical protein
MFKPEGMTRQKQLSKTALALRVVAAQHDKQYSVFRVA